MNNNQTINRLIGVSKTTHTTHDTKDVVVSGIDTNLGSLGTLNGGVGENELKSGIVNSGEVASSRRLVLLRAKGEGVDVDTLIRVSGVGLVRLDPREVRSFTLREAVLAVKLELSGDDRVLAPAVHVQRGLREDEGTGIRDTRVIKVGTIVVTIAGNINTTKIDLVVRIGRTMPVSSETIG
jgi:hypothetical protein